MRSRGLKGRINILCWIYILVTLLFRPGLVVCAVLQEYFTLGDSFIVLGSTRISFLIEMMG